MGSRALALVALLLAGCPEPTPPPEGWTWPGSRVVLVVIDGARYTETLGDPTETWTPRLHGLAREGCAPGPALNLGNTITPYGTASIHTGVWDAWTDDTADHDAHFDAPTHWEYFRKARNAPEEAALFALPGYSWDDIWKPSYDAEYGEDWWPVIRNDGGSDAGVAATFLEAMADPALALAVVYLPAVDGAGHSEDWDRYTAAVSEADRLVGEMWDAIQADPAWRDRTTLLVTSDHGRHDDDHGGFAHHGCSCDGCRQVTFVAAGPDVDPDCAPDRDWTLVDIVPTLGRLLGFTPRDTHGAMMDGLFRE